MVRGSCQNDSQFVCCQKVSKLRCGLEIDSSGKTTAGSLMTDTRSQKAIVPVPQKAGDGNCWPGTRTGQDGPSIFDSTDSLVLKASAEKGVKKGAIF